MATTAAAAKTENKSLCRIETWEKNGAMVLRKNPTAVKLQSTLSAKALFGEVHHDTPVREVQNKKPAKTTASPTPKRNRAMRDFAIPMRVRVGLTKKAELPVWSTALSTANHHTQSFRWSQNEAAHTG